MSLPVITTFRWVPEFARGYVRDHRARWAFEEAGQAYEVRLIDLDEAKSDDHRRAQPFGQVPTYRDEAVELFESGAIVLRIADRSGRMLPGGAAGRAKAVQWLIAALNSIEPFVFDVAAVDLFEAERPWSAMRRDHVYEQMRHRLAGLAAALGDREWLEADFSAGDLVMVSALRQLGDSGLLDQFPNLAAYVARGEARPAFRKAMADHLATFAEAAAA